MLDSSQSQRVCFHESKAFDGVKIFSATMNQERQRLGDRISDWIAENPHLKPTEIIASQSSDKSFHCLTFTLFYLEQELKNQNESV